MPPRKDLSGRRFERLVVLHAGVTRKGHRTWECRCDCGKVTVVRTSDLNAGKSLSCGCYNRERTSESKRIGTPQEAIYRQALRSLKHGAKSRGLRIDVSDAQLLQLQQLPCYYCGHSDTRCTRTHAIRVCVHCSGVDRVDNTLGYVEGNCVPCCRLCNQAKMDLTIDEFFAWVRRVYMVSIESKDTPAGDLAA